MNTISRREFIKWAGAGAGIILAGQAVTGRAEVRTPNISKVQGPRVIYATGFEEGEPAPALKGHEVVSEGARTGKRCLTGEVTADRQARILEIPITVTAGRNYKSSFFVKSDGQGAGCAVWLADAAGKKIKSIQKLTPVPARWTKVEASFTAEISGPLQLQIATPSSFNGAPGRVWLDDLVIEEIAPQFDWSDRVANFPALAASGATLWLATLDRHKLVQGADGHYHVASGANELQVTVKRFEGGRLAGEWILSPQGLTGLASPAICVLGNGCVLAFPAERNDRWQIAYAFIGPEASGAVECRYIESEGTANINPALAAVGGHACVAWESNAGGGRGIWAAWLSPAGSEGITLLSRPDWNSYNPAAAATEDGTRAIVAWDSAGAGHSNIAYSICEKAVGKGVWGPAQEFTSDGRIERHPSVAVRGGEFWLAWQAQSYGAGGAAPKKGKAKKAGAKANAPKVAADASARNEIRLNAINEQRIVVARLNGTQAPLGLFEKVSPRGDFLMRPRIAFDAEGRLWLSARRSLGQNAGWEPLVWSYEGERWSEPATLLEQQGRWQPVPLAATAAGMAAAVQFDEIPPGRDQQGLTVDWRSGVTVRELPRGAGSSAGILPASGMQAGRLRQVKLATEPLKMPPTEFSLAHKQELIASDLPRQKETHSGKSLLLLWGDLHEHTDISICGRAINPPGQDLFANERDIEKLDFCALTDHGYNFDTPQWRCNAELTRYNHDPGRFVTFLGEEWTSSKNAPLDPSKPIGPGNARRYGHHNFIFLESDYPDFYDSYDGDITPADVWKQIGDDHDFVCIPHELADWQGQGGGNPPTDWSFTDEKRQPVAEIFQARQSYEYFGAPRQAPQGAPFAGYYYLQDAWAKGIIIGVIASPDHGGGSGKAGVWAEEFTREGIFKALHARHTFGTSGAKMGLFFRAGAAMMGDKVPRPAGPVTFEVKAVAQRPIKELVIFRNNKIVFRAEPGKKELRIEWKEEKVPEEKLVWYYARIHAEDDELAWTSPIWFE